MARTSGKTKKLLEEKSKSKKIAKKPPVSQTTMNTKRRPCTCQWTPPPTRIVPARSIPKKVIQAMVAASAHKEHVPGEGMCVLRIDSVDSPSWKVYIDWVFIPGKGHPLAMAPYYPWQFDLQPCNDKTLSVMDEAGSIVNQFATLELDDFQDSLSNKMARLSAPVCILNIQIAHAAIPLLPRAISNPGETFPTIDRLQHGTYTVYTVSDILDRFFDRRNVTGTSVRFAYIGSIMKGLQLYMHATILNRQPCAPEFVVHPCTSRNSPS
ncbi:hypothetical protein AeNC1_016227 [Aphanomyces euteiches]|nr:hypothetical protein AeNC1_016227 [Aphanomyces euteiches]